MPSHDRQRLTKNSASFAMIISMSRSEVNILAMSGLVCMALILVVDATDRPKTSGINHKTISPTTKCNSKLV